MDALDKVKAAMEPEEREILAVLAKGMNAIWEDAGEGDAMVVHEYLLDNLSANAATAFRDKVAGKRKKAYMRDYMRVRRKELLRTKQEQGTAFEKQS